MPAIKPGNRKNTWKIRALIFFILLCMMEIGLRMAGYKPGVLINWAYVKGEPQNDSILYGDEYGITHYVKDNSYFDTHPVNNEGFQSAIDFDSLTIDSLKKSGKKIVMITGDSYLAGCCADAYQNSFAGILSENTGYTFLNFGVGGADPVQYLLVTEKYLPVIRPDLLVTIVYLGNDIMQEDRDVIPGVPVYYHVKDGPWLASRPPANIRVSDDQYFNDFNAALNFYMDIYSLRRKNVNMAEALIRNSVILSRIYLGVRFKLMYEKKIKPVQRPAYTYQYLEKITRLGAASGVKTLLVAIPSPGDVKNKVAVFEQYQYVFGALKWDCPHNLQVKDYDGLSNANHFNNTGHKKYADWLDSVITTNLNE